MTRISARKSTAKSSRRSQRKTSRRKSGRSGSRGRRWSARVTRESDALDLDRGVFTKDDPKCIAASLKRSAERSRRRKADPYRSALSMLTFYINRAGKNLPASRRKTLQRAKGELRKQFGRRAFASCCWPRAFAMLGPRRGRSSVVERQLPKLSVQP
jgi:hypothetical protein